MSLAEEASSSSCLRNSKLRPVFDGDWSRGLAATPVSSLGVGAAIIGHVKSPCPSRRASITILK